MNVLKFCDHIIVLDNLSTDRTRKIVQNITNMHDQIEMIDVRNSNNTQKHLENLLGINTWVLGVDADEFHDPIGLTKFEVG